MPFPSIASLHHVHIVLMGPWFSLRPLDIIPCFNNNKTNNSWWPRALHRLPDVSIWTSGKTVECVYSHADTQLHAVQRTMQVSIYFPSFFSLLHPLPAHALRQERARLAVPGWHRSVRWFLLWLAHSHQEFGPAAPPPLLLSGSEVHWPTKKEQRSTSCWSSRDASPLQEGTKNTLHQILPFSLWQTNAPTQPLLWMKLSTFNERALPRLPLMKHAYITMTELPLSTG